MTGNTRNLLLFVSLAGAALATWVLARITEQTNASTVDSGPSLQGYYLLGATLLGTDDQGQVDYRIVADRVEQQDDGEALVLTKMSVEYTPETDVRWKISAARGTAHEDLNVLELQEEVRLVYLADAEQDETVFETSNLQLVAGRFFASSDQPVTMRKGRASVTATGLELDLDTDFWKLKSDVAIRFAR
jgi:LPS export ABC transporter protein LptC